MTAIRGLLRPGAQTIALTAMNGRGDILGISLPGSLLDDTPSLSATAVDRGDSVHVLPGPDDHPKQILRLYLSALAIDRDDAWIELRTRGFERTITYMNGRQDTVGLSLPTDPVGDVSTEYDVVAAPYDHETLDVFVPGPEC